MVRLRRLCCGLSFENAETVAVTVPANPHSLSLFFSPSFAVSSIQARTVSNASFGEFNRNSGKRLHQLLLLSSPDSWQTYSPVTGAELCAICVYVLAFFFFFCFVFFTPICARGGWGGHKVFEEAQQR